MIHRIYESFFTMGKPYGDELLASVYKNPTSYEWNKYILPYARGFIDLYGNLYMEGYEKNEHSEDQGIIHHFLFQMIQEKDPELDFNKLLSVQRYGDTNEIWVGESNDYVRASTIKKYYDRARVQNPSLKFVLKKIKN